jgi:hypothetical protein
MSHALVGRLTRGALPFRARRALAQPGTRARVAIRGFLGTF